MMMNQTALYSPRGTRRALASPTRQRGLTLVELMIGLLLAMLVTLAATAALMASRQGFSAVDDTSQLRDNARFASTLVQRVVAQAGYEDHSTPGVKLNESKLGGGVAAQPYIQGMDDTGVTVPAAGPSYQGGKGVNGSDVLVVRFQGSSLATLDAANPNAADGSIIDCAGNPLGKTTGAMPASVLYVSQGTDGEPALMCGFVNPTTGQWTAQPLVRGVETLQVRYGVDSPNVPPGTKTTDLPQTYLPASALQAPANPPQELANWQRVKAVRIGMVMRGPVGSALVRGPQAASTAYPLGETMHDANDKGTELAYTGDGRLRHAVTFTVYLRNPQSW